MIIKLPVLNENKIIQTLFQIKKQNNFLVLNEFNATIQPDNNDNLNYVKILLFNNYNGYEIINLYLPFKMQIIGSKIYSNYFFTINILSTFKNNLDFIYLLDTYIQQKYKLSFIKDTDFLSLTTNIVEYVNNQYLQLVNNKKFNKDYWELIILLQNICGYLIWINHNGNYILKKILNITNTIKNIKYMIDYSNPNTVKEHLIRKLNNELTINEIEINNIYYLLINNTKIILVKVTNIQNDLILIDGYNSYINFDKYKWYYYSPDTTINDKKIFFNFVIDNKFYKSIILKINPKNNEKQAMNIIDYYTNTNIKSSLRDLLIDEINTTEKVDLNILKNNKYSNDFFILCVNTYKYQIILDILFTKYVYPIKYNKKEIDDIFDKILYISLLNVDTIIVNNHLVNNINIPNKLKLLYFNILKTFIFLKEKNINTVKYISDNLHYNLIKILFSTKSLTFNLLSTIVDSYEINKFKLSFQTNFIILDIINKLNWSNIPNRLDNLKYLINNQEYFMFNDKSNKNLINDNFDQKIKSIVLNPIEMFKYLKYENDFTKWLLFLGNKYLNFYLEPIKLSGNDLSILGKILFYLIKVKEQNFNDIYYKKLIYFGMKYPEYLISNSRINLKIKENFPYLKCNLNLGILAKHLTQNNDYIEFNIDDKSEVELLKNKLLVITKKYLKYKKKYLKYKDLDHSSSST